MSPAPVNVAVTGAAGQICYYITSGQFQTRHEKLADIRWGKELAVLDFLFCFAVCVVIIEILSLQSVKATVTDAMTVLHG